MSVMADPYFETFQDTAGQWRWRLKAGNGRKIATSGESFTRRADAMRAATNVKHAAPLAKVRLPAVKIAPLRKRTTPQAAALATAIRAVGRTKP
jgi:uncharacterized protein